MMNDQEMGNVRLVKGQGSRLLLKWTRDDRGGNAVKCGRLDGKEDQDLCLNTTMCWRGNTSSVSTHSRRCGVISLRTWASVILWSGLMGTVGSSPRNSTKTMRPAGLSAFSIASTISYG